LIRRGERGAAGGSVSGETENVLHAVESRGTLEESPGGRDGAVHKDDPIAGAVADLDAPGPRNITQCAPTTSNGWSPGKFRDRHEGMLTLADAFAGSVNTVATDTAWKVGIPNVIEVARRLGIDRDLPEVPSLAPGTTELSLLELTGAYSTMANQGLASTQGPDWRVSFSEIETILEFTLPDSARLHRPWWANQTRGDGHSHSLAWQAAGWKTREVDLVAETLVFEREEAVGPQAGPSPRVRGTVSHRRGHRDRGRPRSCPRGW